MAPNANHPHWHTHKTVLFEKQTPLLRCASYFLSQILKAWKIQRKKNKKQSTRIINAKHKNQNLKVLFSNPLYIEFLSVFFFSLLIFRLTISPRWVYLSMFYVWAAEFSNVSQLATESQPKLLFHTHKNYMMFRHCYSNIDNGRVIINKFLMFDKYLGERENEFFLETMQSDSMCVCFFLLVYTHININILSIDGDSNVWSVRGWCMPHSARTQYERIAWRIRIYFHWKSVK